MENFFDRKTSVIGLVLDIGDQETLDVVKNAVINYVRRLESATEDKVYIYRPGVGTLNRWVGESVAEIASFRDMSPVNPEHALTQTIHTLMLVDSDQNKHIFYVTDRYKSSQARRFRRAMSLDTVHCTGCAFTVIGIGVSKDLEDVEQHPRCTTSRLGKTDITPNTFEDLFNAAIAEDEGETTNMEHAGHEAIFDDRERDYVSEVPFDDQRD